MQLAVGPMIFDVSTYGPDDGEPVLLLHGFPEGVRAWDAVGGLLGTAGLRLAAPAQRGYSPGARPVGVDAYAIDLLVADAAGILDALGWASAHVVAHDWGAMVGWVLAATSPGRVRSLTAASVPHPASFGAALRTDPDQQHRSAYMRLFRIEGKAEQVLSEDGGAALRQMLDGSGLDAAGVADVVDPLLLPGALTAALSWYRAMRTEDYVSVPAVAVPTTYAWGVDDIAVGRVAAQGCAEHATGPYRFVPMEGVGHWIPEQVPDVFAALVLEQVRG